MESSQTRDWTCVPCIGGQILNHWPIREVPSLVLIQTSLLSGLSYFNSCLTGLPPSQPCSLSSTLAPGKPSLNISDSQPSNPSGSQETKPRLLPFKPGSIQPKSGLTRLSPSSSSRRRSVPDHVHGFSVWPAPASTDSVSHPRKGAARMQSVFSTLLQPHLSTPTPGPCGVPYGAGSAPHRPQAAVSLPGRLEGMGMTGRGRGLLASSLSWAGRTAPYRNLLPRVSPLFQFSSLFSDSDCTCYFFSSLWHHVNKRCRHLFHNKKENYEALAPSFSSPKELLKPLSLFPLSLYF